MDKSTPVSVIMTKKVIVADPASKFTDIQKLFLNYQVYHLPVVEDDKLIGIISLKDALKCYVDNVSKLNEGDEKNINEVFTVESVMTHNPNTVSPSTTVGEAVAILSNANFRSLPVVDADNKIVGIISNKDLVKTLNKIMHPPSDDDRRYSTGTPGRAV